MLKYLFVVALATAAASADAEVYKCQGANGKTQFSDLPCKTGDQSEIMPERAPITPQMRNDAQQRAAQSRDEAAANDRHGEPAAPRPAATPASPAAQDASPPSTAIDENATANCVRDVERQPASQNIKAEMIAACRTAGPAQRSTGMTAAAVGDCVRAVERTGAAGNEKARQLAICHGGDVRAERRHP